LRSLRNRSENFANFIQLDPKELQSHLSNGSKNKPRYLPRLVVRLAGSDFDDARKYLATLQPESETLIIVENLDEAVAQAVRLAKLTAYKK
jgi:succinyl-CoA synthetase beta subunit